MNITEARHLVNEVSDVMHSLPEEDRAISEDRYIAEHTGMDARIQFWRPQSAGPSAARTCSWTILLV